MLRISYCVSIIILRDISRIIFLEKDIAVFPETLISHAKHRYVIIVINGERRTSRYFARDIENKNRVIYDIISVNAS